MGDSHLEGLGSVNKVAEEKAKIFQGSGNLSKFSFLKVVLRLPSESNLEEEIMILKSGDPSDHKLEKNLL